MQKDSFESILLNAIKEGENLLGVLKAEDFELASDMTDTWGQTILSIFTKEWSEEDIQANNELVKKLLILQDDLTREAEAARNKLSKLAKQQNEQNRAASAYQSTGGTYSD